jgi:hypothetical protein
MSFAEMKKRFVVSDEPRFKHITDHYKIQDGWYNEDRPEHRVYLNPAFPGVEFFSATTMLGKIAEMKGENGWIEEWVKTVGEEEAKRITEEALTRGTHMHQNLQDYVENQPVVNRHQQGYMLFERLRPWCDERITAVVASEAALASKRLRIAGRLDLLALLDGDKEAKTIEEMIDSGVETLVDFKSSRRIKERQDIGSYFRQTTIYSMLFHETTGIRLELGEIWMAIWNNGDLTERNFEVIFGNYRETVIDELAEYWEAAGQPLDVDECKRFFL